jgi:hypothetical protein
MSRKYKGKEYPKWVITVPPKQIEELGWGEGEFLESGVARQELTIKKENSEKMEKRREVAKRAWETRRRTRE